MSSKTFFTFLFSFIFLLSIIGFLIYWGEQNQSYTLLSSLLIALISIISGGVISYYISSKASAQDLGKYATSALRLSTNIYDGLGECIRRIEQLKSETNEKESIPTNQVRLMLDSIEGMLKLMQTLSLSANDNWRDVLPKEQLEELLKRKELVEQKMIREQTLSSSRQLQTTKRTIKLQDKIPVEKKS